MRKSQTVGAKIVADPDTGAPVEIWPELPSLTELCAKMCEAIKEEAERRIIAVSPVFRQLNDLWATQDSEMMSEKFVSKFASIDAIRSASNDIEEEIASLTSLLDIELIDTSNHPL